MRILVTGAGGQLGTDVSLEAARRQHTVLGTGHSVLPDPSGRLALDGRVVYRYLDITDDSAVKQVLSDFEPDCIIHCAAWTNVDLAEDVQWKDTVYQVNVTGTRNVAEYCKDHDCRFLYMSTDYVFGGGGSEPWVPDSVSFCPLNQYGYTKLEGEREVSRLLEKFYILRTAWVFGNGGKNFVNTMLSLGKTRQQLSVVSDQIGTPTYTTDLARLILDLAETEKYGYYHATNSGGYISWYEFASEIFRQASKFDPVHYYPGHPEVLPVTTDMYTAAKAVRPLNSRLDRSCLEKNGFTPLPDWRDALARYLEEYFKKL